MPSRSGQHASAPHRYCSSCGARLKQTEFVCANCGNATLCASNDLRFADIPSSSDWLWIDRFAISFNGYDYWGDECELRANQARSSWTSDGRLPSRLSDLRACLFFEQRRIHFGAEPDDEAMPYLSALVEAIRARVAK